MGVGGESRIGQENQRNQVEVAILGLNTTPSLCSLALAGACQSLYVKLKVLLHAGLASTVRGI